MDGCQCAFASRVAVVCCADNAPLRVLGCLLSSYTDGGATTDSTISINQ